MRHAKQKKRIQEFISSDCFARLYSNELAQAQMALSFDVKKKENWKVARWNIRNERIELNTNSWEWSKLRHAEPSSFAVHCLSRSNSLKNSIASALKKRAEEDNFDRRLHLTSIFLSFHLLFFYVSNVSLDIYYLHTNHGSTSTAQPKRLPKCRICVKFRCFCVWIKDESKHEFNHLPTIWQ